MPHKPTPLDSQVIRAADLAAYWLQHKWAIPMLLALWRGPMSRDKLFAAVGFHRPDSHLTPSMFSRTAQDLEEHGFLTIRHAREHPDTQEGATYVITGRARAVIPALRDSLLFLVRQSAR